MWQQIHTIWVELGAPSIISALNAASLAFFARKILTAASKEDVQQEIDLKIALISYRLDKLEKK